MKTKHYLGIVSLVFAVAFASCKTETKQNNTNSKVMTTNKKTDQYVFSTENLKRYQFPTHINDLIIDRSKSQFSEVFMVVVEPNNAPPFHKHDDTEQVFYMVEGTGVLTIGDTATHYRVKPGDVIRIPVSTYHSIKADSNNVVRYLCVDCFGERPKAEPTWDDHVKAICKLNGWDYNDVIASQLQK